MQATTSGGSWFSTQFFYSTEFYNRTALAESPGEIELFVQEWMATYLTISSTIDNQTKAQCNMDDVRDNRFYDTDTDYATNLEDACELLVKYDYDWALFIQAMLRAASEAYADPDFVDRLALPENRIRAMQQTDLLIQAALVPNSRIRNPDSDSAESTAVYLGYDKNSNDEEIPPQIFTVPLSAAYVVEDNGAGFVWGYEDFTKRLQTYLATTPADHSWSDWEDFTLYSGDDYSGGTIKMDNTQVGATQVGGTFRTPFGGTRNTTVLQIAAISSAAGGSGSPRVPSVYTQMFSISYYEINEAEVDTVWRVLAGIAAGLGAGILLALGIAYFGHRWDCCREQKNARKTGCFVGILVGVVVGLLTGFLYGAGSIVVPTFFDDTVDKVYSDPQYDNFAVCTQWPNSCGEQDGFLIDGWFIDNPALVINVGHYQQKRRIGPFSNATVNENSSLKIILTNCNDQWDTVFNRAQLLQYFSTYFNQGVVPGEYLWAPTYYTPFRSPQIFEEYLDEDGLDALLEPIEGSNMTTARLTGTTVDNPSFGVVAGLAVEILLINLNEDITTLVIGEELVATLTQPLADMARHIAASQTLVERVRAFVAA